LLWVKCQELYRTAIALLRNQVLHLTKQCQQVI